MRSGAQGPLLAGGMLADDRLHVRHGLGAGGHGAVGERDEMTRFRRWLLRLCIGLMLLVGAGCAAPAAKLLMAAMAGARW